MKHHTIIVNPVSGKGHGEKVGSEVERAFRDRRVPFDVLRTERPGHAPELARAARGEIVVAVGGDGTVHEISNGLIGSEKALAVVPAGSGNDFIKSIGVPKNPKRALEIVFRGNVRTIDAGHVAVSPDIEPPAITPATEAFVNGVGAGFDGAVAAGIAEIGFLKGVPLYLLAVLKTIPKFKPPRFRMLLDGVARESRNLLVAIGNGTCAGGGFYLTLDAKVDDGLLDVCAVDAVGPGTILRLIPKVLAAKHRDAKEIKFNRVKEISLSSEDRFYVHADGEVIGRGVRSVTVRIKEGALRIVS